MQKIKKLKYILIGIIFTITIIIISYMIIKKIQTEDCISDNNNIGVNSVEVPIVMYHNITDKDKLKGKYAVTVTEFENDLKYIKEKGYNSISMEELIDYAYQKTKLPEKPIIITFDDGYESFYTFAYPLLRKYNFKAVMSVVGAYTDAYSETDDHNVDYSHLTWLEANEMVDSGFVEIENHTYNMHEITKSRRGCGIRKGESLEEYTKELNEDLGRLQKEILVYTGMEASTFTYPYGHISKESVQIIKDMGFKATLTCYEVVNKVDNSNGDEEWLYNLGRFNRASGKSSEDFFAKMGVK